MQDKERAVIAKMCRGLGLNQVWMGKQAGVHRTKISRWLSGQVELTEDELFKLGEAIDAALMKRGIPGVVTPEQATEDLRKGSVLRRWREEWGIGQAEAGKRAGLSQGAVSGFEQGKLDLDPARVEQLFKAVSSLIEERRASIPRVPLSSLRSLRDIAARPTESNLDDIRKKLIAAQREYIEFLKKKSSDKDTKIAALEKRVADLQSLYEAGTEAALAHAKFEELREKLTVPDTSEEEQ
jgi:transcriptional regulator with XRE-family HTH domain